MSFVYAIDGLESLDEIQNLDKAVALAASRAINATSDWARSFSARAILEQVNFPASYLAPSQGRLAVRSKASPSKLEAVIWARHEPTSLARFVNSKGASGGVRVEVKPGRQHLMRDAFIMKLAHGNVGLAVRTPSGKPPRNAYRPRKITENLWLLYGPSVNQVFKSVREDVARPASERLTAEFLRLLELNNA